MADILFKCPNCTKHLVVDGAAVGKTLKCVDCGSLVQVPRPTSAFKCPLCDWVLSAPSSIAGERFHCPNCDELMAMPSAPETSGPSDRKRMTRVPLEAVLANPPSPPKGFVTQDRQRRTPSQKELREAEESLRKVREQREPRGTPTAESPRGWVASFKNLQATPPPEPLQPPGAAETSPGLTKCRECGKDLGRSAATCPHCGANTTTGEDYALGCMVVVGLTLLFFAWLIVADSLTSSNKAAGREDSRPASATSRQSYEAGKSVARIMKGGVGSPEYSTCLQVARRQALDYPDVDLGQFEMGFHDGWYGSASGE